MTNTFLPVSAQEMVDRGWQGYDFLLVTGDAYVDHPSFGAAVIGRVLASQGYKVAILAQPPFQDANAFRTMGTPRLGTLITGGNIDSMVAHYTAAKKRRGEDDYSPRREAGLRPDRAVLVYAHRTREAFGAEMPIILGGLEASLRRFAHYDYWEDKVRRSVLIDAHADILVYGMGERAILDIAQRLQDGYPVTAMGDIRGICYRVLGYPPALISKTPDASFMAETCPSYDEVRTEKFSYATAFMQQYQEHDAVTGKAVLQWHGDQLLVQTPPALPLTTAELDTVGMLPYVRDAHPQYEGGIKAVEEVRFSLIHNRGCFGACHFCSLAFHQGRVISTRSHDSIEAEATLVAQLPDFKGYIHDVGGPTANFRHPSCQQQEKHGMCRHRACLTPTPCPKLNRDSEDYRQLLQRLRTVPNVKKVFVRSGLRYDHLLLDSSGKLLAELTEHHISGQLKVAPEHCVGAVLDYMGKPHWNVYTAFAEQFAALNHKFGKKQFLVPYLISSHPGCTLKDAVTLAVTLHSMGKHPEQVQDFYPTPGTMSTCMYYTGLDPRTMQPIFVAKTPRDKAMQRALLQWHRPDKRVLVIEALQKAGRTDLIGFGAHCLIRPLTKPKRPHTR